MKVGLISTESLITPPAKYGGIESLVFDLAKGLVDEGIDLTLFACIGSRSPGKLVEVIEEGWGKTGQCEEFERRMVSMKEVLQEFDILHDHSHQKPSWKIHEKVVNTMHWEQHPSQCNYINVTGISNYIATWLRQFMPDRDIPVVHHGVDLSDYKYNENKQDYFLFLSALRKNKGAEATLEIAKAMGFEVYFAGMGGDTEGLIKEAAKKYHNIHYLGEVTKERKKELYSNAKALLFPSGIDGTWEEPLGLVALEAMASGTPVIGWDAGALRETISHGRTGFLCNTMDELRDAVKQIDRITCKECKKWIEERFAIKVMAQKYVRLYKRALEGGW